MWITPVNVGLVAQKIDYCVLATDGIFRAYPAQQKYPPPGGLAMFEEEDEAGVCFQAIPGQL